MARVKKSKRYPPQYDSRFEYDVHRTVLKDFRLHPEAIDYYTLHKYIPDFELDNILIEVKGRCRTRQEATKYIWVRQSMRERGDPRELVFLFQDPNKPMPGARKRKDGTKFSHGDWAEKNGFRYYSVETIKELLDDKDS